MSDAFVSSHVNHFGVANRDYVCTQSNGDIFILPKDTRIIIMDMNLSRDRFVIRRQRSPGDNLYSRLSIQAAQSLIINLPERRWTTEGTQDRLLRAMTDVQTVDKYNKSITYSEEHRGYVSRMSTDGMFFIVNILHGPDIGRKGVRVHVKYGRVMNYQTCEMTHWMHRRLEFLKDYTCIDGKGKGIHTFKKGDRSCIARGIGAGIMVLRATSPQVEAHRCPLRIDISAHAVKPDTVYYEQDHISHSYYNKSYLFRDGWWIRADRLEPEDAATASSIEEMTNDGWGSVVGGWGQ